MPLPGSRGRADDAFDEVAHAFELDRIFRERGALRNDDVALVVLQAVLVDRVAAGRGAFVCGYHANQSPLAPEKYLTGAEWAWGNVYSDFVKKAQAGEALGNFVRGGLKDGFVKMSPLGPAVPEEGRKAFDATLAEMMAGGYSIYKNGLKDNKGTVVVPEGTALAEDAIELESMSYLVDGVVGSTS